MAIDGGGGGGGLVGVANSFTGPAQSLEYTGLGWVYAYSGTTGASTTSQTVLDFKTGSKLIVGKMITNGGIQFSSGGGLITSFKISLNDAVVAITQIDTQSDHSPSPPKIDLVIPPYTNVKVEVDSDDNGATVLSTVVFVGRTYG
jgi:hypothetical protein